MDIIEVTTNRHKKDFLNLVKLIYKNDKQYVRPLDTQIEAIFNPQINRLYSNGKATRLLLYQNNRPIGRIAAFINGNKALGYEQPTGGIGFFECIQSQQAATLLFNSAKNWLSNNGMEAMDGPINFGENDTFWGLLVDGFTQPAFGMNYNPPYYRELFENYGFNVYYEQITNHLNLRKPFPERFWRIAERVVGRPGLTFEHFNFKNIDRYINAVIEIHQDAWRFHENFTPLQPQQLRSAIYNTKSFLNEELIWFAFQDGEPIAFIVMFPDINQILKHFKSGKLSWINKLWFLYHKFSNTITRTRVTALGVKTNYQRMGIESGLFYQLRGVVEKNKHLNEMEISWVGDFNPKMRALQEAMESEFGKRHITFRYIFDEQKRQNFTRAPIIPRDTKNLSKTKSE